MESAIVWLNVSVLSALWELRTCSCSQCPMHFLCITVWLWRAACKLCNAGSKDLTHVWGSVAQRPEYKGIVYCQKDDVGYFSKNRTGRHFANEWLWNGIKNTATSVRWLVGSDPCTNGYCSCALRYRSLLGMSVNVTRFYLDRMLNAPFALRIFNAETIYVLSAFNFWYKTATHCQWACVGLSCAASWHTF